MARYAENTKVTSDSSRAEIERTLRRYGASAFAYGWNGDEATVMFELADRRVRFRLPMPDRNAREFTHTPGKGLLRAPEAAEREWEQAQRQRWRALALVIKAKLEAVEAGITTVEQEFLAHIMLPNGQTVGDWAAPQIAVSYERGTMPALMPGSDG
jgi:hypothetical protein